MKQTDLFLLIKRHTRPSGKYHSHCAYSLKTIFECLSGEYISQERFFKAMAVAGYKPNKDNRYKIHIVPNDAISRYYWGKGAEPEYLKL